jgi:hypothetical protein
MAICLMCTLLTDNNYQDSGALGTDSSGNANTFTVNNLTSIDQTTDTPTNNFCYVLIL